MIRDSKVRFKIRISKPEMQGINDAYCTPSVTVTFPHPLTKIHLRANRIRAVIVGSLDDLSRLSKSRDGSWLALNPVSSCFLGTWLLSAAAVWRVWLCFITLCCRYVILIAALSGWIKCELTAIKLYSTCATWRRLNLAIAARRICFARRSGITAYMYLSRAVSIELEIRWR